MLHPLPLPYSANAADYADRLRLIVCDLKMIDLAMTNTHANGFKLNDEEHQAVLMHLRRILCDVEGIKEDILIADQKGRE